MSNQESDIWFHTDWVWSAAGQTPLHHSMRSPNLTSKVRSIYISSVIVVSRNLDREFMRRVANCISFHSSSADTVVEFLRKEWTFPFFSFHIGYSKLDFFFFHTIRVLGAHVQHKWGTGSWWHVSSMPHSLPSHVSANRKCSYQNIFIQMLFRLSQCFVTETIVFHLSNMRRKEQVLLPSFYRWQS